MNSKFNKMYKIIKYVFFLILGYIIRINPKYRDIWIISERGYDARDNAYHLFKYMMSLDNCPNIYYIIDKNSEDFEKISNYKNIVDYDSFRHWLLFAISSKKISTHIMGYSPDIFVFYLLDKWNLVLGKKIFLQHGIIYNDFKELYYPKVKLNMFVCGAKPEFDYVRNNFNHPKDVVKYLGLCRYDNLEIFRAERIILIMPTWRSFLSDCEDDLEFMQTDYYLKYNKLINSPELLNILKEYNYRLIFYPHYEMQRYIHCFNDIDDRIIIASKQDYDVQQLLKTAKLLITDFSSVFFDFAYMKKPILFYHFDNDDNYRKPGYMDLKNCPFGDSYVNESTLVNGIREIINQGGSVSESKIKEIEKFFVLRDSDNCKRAYNTILDL